MEGERHRQHTLAAQYAVDTQSSVAPALRPLLPLEDDAPIPDMDVEDDQPPDAAVAVGQGPPIGGEAYSGDRQDPPAPLVSPPPPPPPGPQAAAESTTTFGNDI